MKKLPLVGILLLAGFPICLGGPQATNGANWTKERIQLNVDISKEILLIDSVAIFYYTNVIDGRSLSDNRPNCTVREKVYSQKAKIEIDCGDRLGYFTLAVKKTSNSDWERVIYLCPIQGNATYKLKLTGPEVNGLQGKIDYSAVGENATSITCFKELSKVREAASGEFSFLDSELRYIVNNDIDIKRQAMLICLERYRTRMPEDMFNLFLSDIMFGYEWLKYDYIVQTCRVLNSETVRQQLESVLRNDCKIPQGYFEAALKISKFAPRTIVTRAIAERYVKNGDVDYDAVYSQLKNSCSGKLRERMLLYYFSNYGRAMEHFDSLLHDAKQYIESKENYRYIGLLEGVTHGKLAYEFELPDSSGRLVRLSDFRGKIVFIDFWFTGCAACKGFYRNQLKEVEEYFKNDTNVVFITVSVDRNLSEWKRSLRSGEYTSSSAVNLYTGGQSYTHPIIEHYSVNSYPRPILIDKKGNVYKPGKLTDFRNGLSLRGAISSLLQQM